MSSCEKESSEPSSKKRKEDRMLNLAVAGCSHGELDVIYAKLGEVELQRREKFDLLICCGDFQANRNYGDLHYFHSPMWHRKLKTFYKYYSGFKKAPLLTIFVGGNHESASYLAELPNGGWVAPNIYYMGYASVMNFAGLRIAGLSGIFKSHDFNKGHFERPPFSSGSHISAYHVRSTEIFRLKQLKSSKKPFDIFVTHDWPSGITEYGDKERLLRIKNFLKEDIETNRLGNPATMDLLVDLKPRFWFSAHMHVKFEALVEHKNSEDESLSTTTKFVALDKPVFNKQTQQLDRRRTFLEFFKLPISEDSKLELSYDPEWLAILKNTDFLTQSSEKIVYMPGKVPNSTERTNFFPTNNELEDIFQSFANDLNVPLNFLQTAPPQTFESEGNFGKFNSFDNIPPTLYYRNPQSTLFCKKIKITDMNELFAIAASSDGFIGVPHYYAMTEGNVVNQEATTSDNTNPDEIDINLDDEFGEELFVVD